MTQEEKAKTYDELFIKAKQIYNKENDVLIMHTIEDLFPELKESEDERIRKAIISGMKSLQEKGKYTEFAHIPMNDVFAWLEKQNSNIDNANKEYWRGYREGKQEILDKYADLEKQGEQKPTDKVEPKFHEGDWVFIEEIEGYKQGPFQIKYLSKQGYCFDKDRVIPFCTEDLMSLWTIQDAKDGDVLALINGQCIFLFDGHDKEYCCYSKLTNSFSPNLNYIGFIQHQFVPATKEQRDLLFSKMKEAGYEWDAEKKELKKDYPDNLPKDNWELIHEFVEKLGRIPKEKDELDLLVEYVLKRRKSA